MPPDPILAVDHLTVRFDVSASWLVRTLAGQVAKTVHAVEDVSFAIGRGTTFALVGESGCGKTTIARAIAGIQRPTAGRIAFQGVDTAIGRNRRDMQMVFQDPYASLDPGWRVGRIIAEPIVTHRLLHGRAAIEQRVAELLALVGLSPGDAGKRPHQFSGGQRQRISIARALASDPAFIVCDEPTSALDVSVQAQVLNLMRGLQRRLGLTYLLISHNLAAVAHMADMVAVMYLGRIVEHGPAEAVLRHPLHPYTRMLLATLPRVKRPGPRPRPLAGEMASPLSPPPGCALHPRCTLANARCAAERPILRPHGPVEAACHAAQEGRLPTISKETPE